MPDLSTMRAAVRAWVDRAEQDERVKACWLEGPTPIAVRTFDGPLDLHVGVEEPAFDAFAAEIEAFLGAAAPVRSHADGPAEPDAWATVAELDGIGAVTCTLERMSLLAKRARAAVHPLFDRSGQLRHVLDYSASKPRPAPTRRAAGGVAVKPHPELLDASAIAAALGALPDWHRQGNEIIATFKMPSFLSGVGLVGEVALAAERARHHPNMLVRYRTIAFSLSTHEAGGVTQRDLELAAQISALAGAVKAGKKPKLMRGATASPKRKTARKRKPARAKTAKKPKPGRKKTPKTRTPAKKKAASKPKPKKRPPKKKKAARRKRR